MTLEIWRRIQADFRALMNRADVAAIRGIVDPDTGEGYTEVRLTADTVYGSQKLQNLCAEAGRLFGQHDDFKPLIGRLPVPLPTRDADAGRWVLYVAGSSASPVDPVIGVNIDNDGTALSQLSFTARMYRVAAEADLAIDRLLSSLPVKGAAAPRGRRRRKSDKTIPLTPKQLEAVQIVGECKGNFTDAARRLGRNPSTIRQHYQAGTKKLGKTAVLTPQTKQLQQDRRGQSDVANDDDRRGYQ